MNNRPFIPFHIPSIGEEEIREVEATLRSGCLTTGQRTIQFEKDVSAYVGARHAIAVNSCTAALLVSLAALGIGDNDEIITTPLTFCSTVLAILQAGARPVLADIRPDGTIDPHQVERAITLRTRAIVPVHFAGMPCEMKSIWSLARDHGLFVVEDAAHGLGTRYQGQPIGMHNDKEASDAVAFSFDGTNNITTGEGGMITTPREPLAKRMRILSLLGINRQARSNHMGRGSWYYEVIDGGFKCNLTDLQSAIGIHQLRKLDSFLETRARYAQIYNQALDGMEEVETPAESAGNRSSWHLYVLRLDLKRLTIDRDRFIEELRQRGIGASVHFLPIPLHPYFAERRIGGAVPHALELYRRIVSLPLNPAMTEKQVRYIADCVRETFVSHRKSRGRLKSGRRSGDERTSVLETPTRQGETT